MYYHAWILSEAVCNASGLGFSGFDKQGNATWDLAKNVDILGFEVSREGITDSKISIDWRAKNRKKIWWNLKKNEKNQREKREELKKLKKN